MGGGVNSTDAIYSYAVPLLNGLVAPVPVTAPAHDEGATGPSPLGTGDGRRRWDSSGDVTYDGLNSYLYDAEGRICALQNSVGSITGYVYDAAGIRVAQGTLTGFRCNLSAMAT